MDSTVSHFTHQSLEKSRKQIRLFRLLPDLDKRNRIQCELRVTNLDSKPEYRAVSYEWGSPGELREISVNGSAFDIRINLWQFLDTLRIHSENNDLPLWIDQITIDQGNDEERNHQVQLMGDIYSSAKDVIVWLGWSKLSVARIWSRMRPLNGCPNRCRFRRPRHVDWCTSCRVTISSSLESREHEVAGSQSQHLTAKESTLVSSSIPVSGNIGSMTYWSRLWIVQEILLAQDVLFLLNEEFISLSNLRTYVSWFEDQGSTTVRRSHVQILLDQASLNKSNLRIPNDPGCTLEGIIREIKPHLLHCADPRDRVYGVLGLVHQSERMAVDYTLSPEETYGALLDRIVLCLTPSSDLKDSGSSRDSILDDELCAVLARLGEQLGYPSRWRIWLDVIPENDKFKSWILFIQALRVLEMAGFNKYRWSPMEVAIIVCTLSSCHKVLLNDDSDSNGILYDFADDKTGIPLKISSLPFLIPGYLRRHWIKQGLVHQLNIVDSKQLRHYLLGIVRFNTGQIRRRRLQGSGGSSEDDPDTDCILSVMIALGRNC